MTDTALQTFAELPPAPAGGDALRLEVQEVVRGIAKALRTHLLYEGQSPALDRFIESLQGRMEALWEQVPSVSVGVDERELLWDGQVVFHSEERDNLAFLLYRDGVREITFRQGFERDELAAFLNLLAHVHRMRGEDEDDLLTLLWEHDWLHFTYRYVEALPEGVQLPGESGEPRQAVTPAAREVEEAPLSTALSVDDFREALYFLDETELRTLSAELEREMRRDLWTDVLNALFDRLQDGPPDRQGQVVGILSDLLPTLLGAARLDTAAYLLSELVSIATGSPLPPAVLRAVRALFDQLAHPETVAELVRTVEQAGDEVPEGALGSLLAYFPPEALRPLLKAGETSAAPRVRRAVLTAAEKLGAAHPQVVTRLASDEDAHVAGGAARLLGRLKVAEAALEVTRLLKRPEAALRLTAVEALQEIRSPSAAGALEGALEDDDREVRIAAARALSELRYAPARARLEAALDSKRLREADLTERIAFFEAYGGLAGEAGVTLLDRVLNGKNWLGRKESAELRACAALGLGRVRHPAAERALNAAAADPDPVVRSAVGRALKGAKA